MSADLLRDVPLFAGLDAAELERLSEAFREHSFEAGSHVTTEGERGARVLAFFVVLEGTALVTKKGREVATLRPGDYFGEIALIQDIPRTATVTAQTDLRCLATSAWAFRPFLEEETPLARRLNETMARRIYELERSGA